MVKKKSRNRVKTCRAFFFFIMDKNTNNIKEYLDQLVWEYGQACQRPRGDLYFIPSGKQCRQGKPVSESVVQAMREQKRKERQESLLGKKSDRGTNPSIDGKIGGVWDEVGTKSPKYPGRNRLLDDLSPEQKDKINKSLVDFLRDREYDPESRKFVPKKKKDEKAKTLDELRKEREKELEWTKEKDLSKLLESRNSRGWNPPLKPRTDGQKGMGSPDWRVRGNDNLAVIGKLKEIVISGKGSLSKSEEELLKNIIVTGRGTDYQRALIEKYITGRTTMVPPEWENRYFLQGDQGSSSSSSSSEFLIQGISKRVLENLLKDYL
jgi:hypothetical protein